MMSEYSQSQWERWERDYHEREDSYEICLCCGEKFPEGEECIACAQGDEKED